MRADEADDVSIATWPLSNVADLEPLLRRSRHWRYSFLQDASPDFDITSLWLEEISETLRNGGQLFVAVIGGTVEGAVICSELDWDTKVTGTASAELKHVAAYPYTEGTRRALAPLLDHAVVQMRSSRKRLLLSRTATNDLSAVHSLERAGFLLVDTLLDYVCDVRGGCLQKMPRPPVADKCRIRLADSRDEEQLVSLATEAFRDHFGRFHADPDLPRAQALAIYEEWMRSSCRGYADWMVVAESDGKLVGGTIWKGPSHLEEKSGIRLGHYSIGMVSPTFGGRGLFSALTYAGMELLQSRVDYVEGPTHVNNHAVQRAYANLRWQIRSARHSFHKWLVQP